MFFFLCFLLHSARCLIGSKTLAFSSQSFEVIATFSFSTNSVATITSTLPPATPSLSGNGSTSAVFYDFYRFFLCPLVEYQRLTALVGPSSLAQSQCAAKLEGDGEDEGWYHWLTDDGSVSTSACLLAEVSNHPDARDTLQRIDDNGAQVHVLHRRLPRPVDAVLIMYDCADTTSVVTVDWSFIDSSGSHLPANSTGLPRAALVFLLAEAAVLIAWTANAARGRSLRLGRPLGSPPVPLPPAFWLISLSIPLNLVALALEARLYDTLARYGTASTPSVAVTILANGVATAVRTGLILCAAKGLSVARDSFDRREILAIALQSALFATSLGLFDGEQSSLQLAVLDVSGPSLLLAVFLVLGFTSKYTLSCCARTAAVLRMQRSLHVDDETVDEEGDALTASLCRKVRHADATRRAALAFFVTHGVLVILIAIGDVGSLRSTLVFCLAHITPLCLSLFFAVSHRLRYIPVVHEANGGGGGSGSGAGGDGEVSGESQPTGERRLSIDDADAAPGEAPWAADGEVAGGRGDGSLFVDGRSCTLVDVVTGVVDYGTYRCRRNGGAGRVVEGQGDEEARAGSWAGRGGGSAPPLVSPRLYLVQYPTVRDRAKERRVVADGEGGTDDEGENDDVSGDADAVDDGQVEREAALHLGHFSLVSEGGSVNSVLSRLNRRRELAGGTRDR